MEKVMQVRLEDALTAEGGGLTPAQEVRLRYLGQVKELHAQAVESGSRPQVERSEEFFNKKEPGYGIIHEKPEHRVVIFMKARGHSHKEIAEATGYTKEWVGQILRQPWAQDALVREINDAGRDELSTIIEGAAKDSLFSLIELRDDENAPASVRANTAQYLVDRFLGKPKQSIEQKIGDINKASDEQLLHIATSASSAGVTKTA